MTGTQARGYSTQCPNGTISSPVVTNAGAKQTYSIHEEGYKGLQIKLYPSPPLPGCPVVGSTHPLHLEDPSKRSMGGEEMSDIKTFNFKRLSYIMKCFRL